MPIILSNTKNSLKHNSLEDLFDYYITKKETEKFTLVVPTGKLSTYLRKKYIKEYFKKMKCATTDVQIINYERYINQLFNLMNSESNEKLVGDSYLYMLFNQILINSNVDGYFKDFLKRKDFKYNLFKFITNLRKKGYGDSYEELFDKDKPERSAYIDELNSLLDKKLKEEHLNDYQASILNIISKSKAELNRCIEQNEVIYFHGFTDFGFLDIKFLKYLNQNAITNIQIHLDYDVLNDNANFSNYAEIISNLSDFNKDDNNLENLDEHFTKYKQLIKDSVFYNKHNRVEQLILPKFDSFRFKNVDEEVESIVKYIKYANIKEGFKLSDICVVYRNSNTYANRFREKFIQNKIPCNITDRFQLSDSQVVKAIKQLLDIYLTGFKYDKILKVIGNKLLKLEKGSNYKELSVKYKYSELKRVIRLVYHHDKFGTHYSIREKIDKIEELKATLTTSENQDRKRFALEYLVKFLYEFDKLFSRFKPSMTINEFVVAIEQLIKDVNLEENIYNLRNEIGPLLSSDYEKDFFRNEIQINFKALSTFNEILKELASNYRKLNTDKILLSDLIDSLYYGIDNTRYQMHEKPNYGVTITSIEQSRNLPFKMFIICGATSDDIPLPYTTEKLIGIELKENEKRHYNKEKMQIYELFTNFELLNNLEERHYVISYPVYSGNVENKQSSIVNKILYKLNVETYSKEQLFNSTKSKDKWINTILKETNIIQKELINTIFKENLVVDGQKTKMLMLSKNLSASNAESYFKCNYMGFSTLLTKKDTDYQFQDKIQKNEIGDLVHWLFSNFYNNHYFNQFYALGVDSSNIAKKYKLIEYIPLVESDYYKLYNSALELFHPYLVDKIDYYYILPFIGKGKDDKNSVLYKWFTMEMKEQYYYPIWHKFKIDGELDFTEFLNEEVKFKVSGEIDRLDYSMNSKLKLVDYKVKSSNFKEDIGIQRNEIFLIDDPTKLIKRKTNKKAVNKSNTTLQLEFYLIALEKIYNINPSYANYSFLHYNTVLNSEDIISESEVQIAKQNFYNGFSLILKKLFSGEILVKPTDTTYCNYCKFSTICKKDFVGYSA
jgi:ATP-dependent helicase/DNAse subunit B